MSRNSQGQHGHKGKAAIAEVVGLAAACSLMFISFL